MCIVWYCSWLVKPHQRSLTLSMQGSIKPHQRSLTLSMHRVRGDWAQLLWSVCLPILKIIDMCAWVPLKGGGGGGCMISALFLNNKLLILGGFGQTRCFDHTMDVWRGSVFLLSIAVLFVAIFHCSGLFGVNSSHTLDMFSWQLQRFEFHLTGAVNKCCLLCHKLASPAGKIKPKHRFSLCFGLAGLSGSVVRVLGCIGSEWTWRSCDACIDRVCSDFTLHQQT